MGATAERPSLRRSIVDKAISLVGRGRRQEAASVIEPILASSVDDFSSKLNKLGSNEPPRLIFVPQDFTMPDGSVRMRRGFTVRAVTPKGITLELPVKLEEPHPHHSEEVEAEEEFLAAFYTTEAINAITHRFTQIIQPGTENDANPVIISMMQRRERAGKSSAQGYNPLKAPEIAAILPSPQTSA